MKSGILSCMIFVLLLMFSAVTQSAVSTSGKVDLLEQDWAFSVLGTGIGISGFNHVDIDGDGVRELVLGGSTYTTNYWHALQFDPSSSEYKSVWTSDHYSYNGYILSIKVTNDKKYILVGRSDGVVEVFNSQGPNLLTRLNVSASSAAILDIEIDDIDNDGKEEWLFLTRNYLYVYSPSNFSIETLLLAYDSTDVAVGDVDGDGRNEVVLSSGHVFEVGKQGVVAEWGFPLGFGEKIALADIDDDGKDEVVGENYYSLSTFDVELGATKYTIRDYNSYGITALYLADVDGDGDKEILYGDQEVGYVHALDGLTGVELWRIRNTDYAVTGMFVGDVDHDDRMEIVWSAGHGTWVGPNRLHVNDLETLVQEYVSVHLDGPFHALDIGDVDNDGKQEIVTVSLRSNGGLKGGILSIFDANTYEKKYQSDVSPLNDSDYFDIFAGTHTMRIGDVDNDGKNEIVVALGWEGDGVIYVLDGVTKATKNVYRYSYPSIREIHSLVLADIDNDGATEIIVGSDLYIYVIDGSTGKIEWQTPNLGYKWGYVLYLKVANVDSDSALEIIASAGYLGDLFVIDGITRKIQRSAGNQYLGIDTADVDLDGITDILAGTVTGDVVSVDGSTLASTKLGHFCTYPVFALRAGNPKLLDNRITFACGNSAGVFDMEKGAVTLRSSVIGATSGDYDALELYEVDGKAKMVVGTDNGIRVFFPD